MRRLVRLVRFFVGNAFLYSENSPMLVPFEEYVIRTKIRYSKKWQCSFSDASAAVKTDSNERAKTQRSKGILGLNS